MPESSIQHVFYGMKYAVRRVQQPPETPGGAPVQQKVLTFATQDESEMFSFALNEHASEDISRMLSRVWTPNNGEAPQGG